MKTMTNLPIPVIDFFRNRRPLLYFYFVFHAPLLAFTRLELKQITWFLKKSNESLEEVL